MKDQMRMMKQVQQMQTRMAQVQESLASAQVEGTAGGGAIRAVATGDQRLVSVQIDPELAGDVEMLQDLVVAAVNDAMEGSRRLAAERMAGVTAGLGLPPGLL